MKRWFENRRPGAPVFSGAVIGDLEGPTALVDDHGRIASPEGTWWLEWAASAEDRWRIAHEEVAVRQSRVADAPVYATWMRVPGGDVVQRVASSNDGLGRVLVVEFENASSSAVAVALIGRSASRARVTVDADAVALDGTEWMRAERPAGGVVAVDGDPWPVVVAGPDSSRGEARGDSVAGGLVLALPHRQRVQIEVLIEGDFPTRKAGPEVIADGWRTITRDSLGIATPDADLTEAWDRIVADLVVQAGSPEPGAAAEAAPFLDIAGLHDEADRARATVVAATEAGRVRGHDAVAALRALASRDLLAGAESGLAELAGSLAAEADTSMDAETLGLVARAVEAHAPKVAGDARRAQDSTEHSSFESLTPAAAAATRVLGQVVDTSTPGIIDLLPAVPESWLGQSVDVRSLGTVNGRVSFSVRWHGERPALLWERRGGSDDVELRCPGLDPSWCTREREGEALLEAGR